jgi:hypothetical protein
LSELIRPSSSRRPLSCGGRGREVATPLRFVVK